MFFSVARLEYRLNWYELNERKKLRVRRGGERMKFTEAIKNKWENFLNKLASENKKNFGDAPLDCCSLNQKQNH